MILRMDGISSKTIGKKGGRKMEFSMGRQLEAAIELAKQGEKNWKCLMEKHPADKFIILPHEESEYNTWAAIYFDDYMKKENARSAVLISLFSSVLNRFDEVSDSYIIEKVCGNKKWVESLLMFYAFHPFSERIVIISLTKPYDTGGENLLGVRGVTERELLCYDIYGFNKIPG